MPINKTTHQAISGYYSSKQPYTNGLIVRNWLVGQSFNSQYEFGINVINTFGVEITTVSTIEISKKIIPEPSPIVIETGTISTTIDSQKGNSSKPIFVYAEGNQISTFGLRGNLAEFKIGFEYSKTVQFNNTSHTNYTNISLNGVWLYFIYGAITGGQSILQPSY